MISQIQPQINYPLARLVQDLGDGATYYPQAVVRNATTNTVLATIKLISQGSQIYAGTWRTPSDAGGQGTYVTVTVTVYVDSAYSVVSPNQGQELITYLIYDQFHLVQGLATQISAMMSDIDYRKIEKILIGVIKKYVKIPAYKQNDYTKAIAGVYVLLEELKTIASAIEMPTIPEYTKPDLAPVIEEIRGLYAQIENHFSEIEPAIPTDLEPLHTKIDGLNMHTSLEQLSGKVEKLLTDHLREVTKLIPDTQGQAQTINERIGEFRRAFSESQKPKPKAVRWPAIARDGTIRNE